VSWHAHFANELTAECIDDAGNGGLLALADEIEVEHALHSAGLQTAVRMLLELAPRFRSCCGLLLDKASGLGVEESVCSRWAQWAAGSYETTDVVVGRKAFVRVRGAGLVGSGPVDWDGGRHRGRFASIEDIELLTKRAYGYMRDNCQ
jgi:hypothetical protein